MKRFKFRLESVLRVLRIEQDQARARLLAANAAVAHAEATVAARREHYGALARPHGVQPLPIVDETRATLDRAAGAIAWADLQRGHCVAVAHDALRAWAEARQRVRALERLRESAIVEYGRAAQRETDRVADELATTRHRTREVTA